MLRKLISPHYLGFYACLWVGMIAAWDVTPIQMFGIIVCILVSNLVGVSQGWHDAYKQWIDSHE